MFTEAFELGCRVRALPYNVLETACTPYAAHTDLYPGNSPHCDDAMDVEAVCVLFL